MNFIQRRLKPRPYAANSTGRPRGTLNLGSRIGRVQIYEAIGEAREIFVDKLSQAIVTHLNEHNSKLQDSASFVDLSLFMMGKSPDRTKPVVMFVSNDKVVRKDAFGMIKRSGIMDDYPEFGLGEMELKAEFESLQPLGSQAKSTSVRAVDPQPTFVAPEELVEVLTTKTGSLAGRQLKVNIQNGSTTNTNLAAAGGVVSYKGSYMLHSVDHFLQLARIEQDVGISHQSLASEGSEDDSECEVMGLSDDEEEDDGCVDATSRGSATPILSDSESTSDSLLESEAQEDSTSLFGSFNDQDIHISALQSRLEMVSGQPSFDAPSNSGRPARIGQVALRSALLDSTFVRIDMINTDATGLDISQLRNAAIPLESYREHIETVPSDTAIKTSTPNGTIAGMLSGTPSFVRLPGSKVFQEVYVAMLEKPLLPGDCGSWIKNAVSGKLFGHVIAGSPTTGLVLLIPAAKVFGEALAAFSTEEVKLQGVRSIDGVTNRPLTLLDAPDEYGAEGPLFGLGSSDAVDDSPISTCPSLETGLLCDTSASLPYSSAWTSSSVLDSTKSPMESAQPESLVRTTSPPKLYVISQHPQLQFTGGQESIKSKETMAFPFDIGQIHGVLEVLNKVINVYRIVYTPHKQYLGFKQDLDTLKERLERLQRTIGISQARTGTQLVPDEQLEQVFGNFKERLEDCLRLLESQARYCTQQSPVFKARWFLRVKDEVGMHRDRIAFLNIKLSLVLQCLEIDQLGARVSRALGEPLLTEPPRHLDILQQLGDHFKSITATTYGSPTSIPIAQGVNEVIFYLDRATQWHVRRHSTHGCQAFQLANLLRASWLLQATKASDEYQEVSNRITIAEFGRQFPLSGMTVRQFLGKLEEKIFEVYVQLARSEAQPPLHQLQTIIEQDRNAWQEHDQWKPGQGELEDDSLRRGERVAVCRLWDTSTNTNQTLDIYQQKDQEHLSIITYYVNRGDREYIHQVDLKRLNLTSSLEPTTPNRDLYSVTLGSIWAHRESGFRLAFRGKKDLFEFQKWMTGYKVVDDYPNTLVTSQRKISLLRDKRRSDTGRVQIWSSRVEASSRLRRSTQSRTVSSSPPTLAPLPSFSQLSLPLEPSTHWSLRDYLLAAQPVSSTRSGTPSLTSSNSTIASTVSGSSISSLGGLRRWPTNMVEVYKRENAVHILDRPDPPRLVVLLPATEGQRRGSKEGAAAESGSLLMIDLDQNIRIIPTVCDCQHDRAEQGQGASVQTAPRQPAPPPPSSRSQCRKVVLQAENMESITARETDANADLPWNLASAGRYQNGEGLVPVKRLKKVTLEFGSVEERIRFVEYFTGLRMLYL